MTPAVRHGTVVGFALFFLAGPLPAAESDWLIHTWQSDDGLPNNNVTSVAQSPDGYLWIADPSRLARFDGVSFVNIASRDIVPEYRQKFTTLLRSRNGGLWMGMDRGTVVYLDGNALRIYTNNLPGEYVNSLLEDDDGGVWITFAGQSICRIHNGQVTRFGATNGLPSGYTCGLARDNHGGLWFAKGSQVGTVQDGRFVMLADLRQTINGIAAASQGGVWVNAENHLLRVAVDGSVDDYGAFSTQKVPPQASPLMEDSDHSVWIGTLDTGLFRFNGSGFEKIPVSHRQISCLFKDDENNLWVGTGGGGLNRVTRRTVELESTEKGLPFEAVQSICEDNKGVIWATTQNGFVACRSNDTWSVVITNRSRGGMASCVAADTNGTLWIGTHSSLLDTLNDGIIHYIGKRDGLAGRVIHALLVTRSGDIILGQENPEAIQRYHDGKFFTYKLPPNLRVIRALVEDQAGNIWVGTSTGVLLRLTGDEVFDETAHTTGVPMAIRCFYVDPEGALWIGYAGWGLGRLKDGRFKRISVENGLYDYNISQIVADDRGWMWFGADHGIFKARQHELGEVMAGRLPKMQCVHYGRDEGLPSLQANFGDCPGAMRSHDGRLWMPMRSALAVIDPDKISEHGTPAHARLEQVIVDEKLVAAYGSILPVRTAEDLRTSKLRLRLPPGYRRLEFDFTAPNFTAPENVRFRYCLVGFDNHWIDAATQRKVTYSRLAAGDYEFKVAACNSDGVWETTNASLMFTVDPFFWQTWWFRLCALALVVIIVRYISVHRLRRRLQSLEQQAALDKERARIAKDLHDDLGTRLTKIILLTGLAQRDLPERLRAEEHLKKISSAARRVVKSLDETVWAVNPRNDTLPHLIGYIGQFAVEFLQSAEIRCRVDLPEHPPERLVPAAARHNLFLAVKEALNNIVRHSNATEVWLRIVATDESLGISIEDNGRGFGLTPEREGADGLLNMRQRLEEIGGEFRLTSNAGGGTQISFICPWRNGR